MKATEIRDRLIQPWRHGEALDLAGIIVEDVLDLSDQALCGVDFRGARFARGLIARNARLNGLCWFQDAHFGAPVDLSGALFVNDARFDGAHFDAAADFHGAEFRGTVGLRAARFQAAADFGALTCYGNADLSDTRFGEAVRFAGSEFLGGIWAQSAAFPPEADFTDTQVHGRLWLRNATCGNAPLDENAFGLTFGYTYR